MSAVVYVVVSVVVSAVVSAVVSVVVSEVLLGKASIGLNRVLFSFPSLSVFAKLLIVFAKDLVGASTAPPSAPIVPVSGAVTILPSFAKFEFVGEIFQN